MSKIIDGLYYSESHEFVKVEGDFGYVGITDYAQHELGDIVYVDVTSEGEKFAAGEVFGTIEAVKTVADLLMPVNGEVVEFNANLEGSALVNNDPYGEGWIIKIRPDNAADIETLLDAEAYTAKIAK